MVDLRNGNGMVKKLYGMPMGMGMEWQFFQKNGEWNDSESPRNCPNTAVYAIRPVPKKFQIIPLDGASLPLHSKLKIKKIKTLINLKKLNNLICFGYLIY